jgi:pyroglutamyl-peptidase
VIYDHVSRRYVEQFPPVLAHHSPERPCPLLVIHVGVAGGSDSIRLEQQAFNQTHGKDVSGKEPQSGRVDEREPAHQIRTTAIDLPRLRQHVVQQCQTTHSFTPRITISQDPGRYLCNFIYYKGLQTLGPSLVLFVHVPEEGRPHSIAELTTTLQHIIDGYVPAAFTTGRGTFSA